MTWNSTTEEEIKTAQRVVLWIKTARESGYGAEDWLPTYSDILKSALFERLRNGKEPLPFPPPRAMSCPWYAVVEDVGPHYIGNNDNYGPVSYGGGMTGEKIDLNDMVVGDKVIIYQGIWKIEEKLGYRLFVISDDHHKIQTPYRFYLWYDPDWVLPNLNSDNPEVIARYTGGWFLRNVDFGLQDKTHDGDR